MIDLDLVFEGLAILSGPETLAAVFAGLAAGIVIGALPGLTATMAVAVLAPFTFFMDATVGIPFLLGIYKGAIYGGSIPAITINTPGTAAAAASARDGYALMSAGKGRKALEMSLYASVIADFLATWVLILVAAPLAAIAIRFGPPEFALLYIFALMTIASVSGGNFRKGVLAAGLGLLIACVGLEPRTGGQRFTFDSPELMGGISLVPLLIGMFALSEILIQIEQGVSRRMAEVQRRAQAGEVRLTWPELRENLRTIVRSSGLGAGLGALPGLGAEIACWIAYGVARNRSKRPEEYGRGSLEGLAAAEAGNNAVVPSALIPMTVFGIPGDTVTAILLGAFMAQGIMPGPLLMQQHGGILYGLFAVLLVTNALLLVLGFFAIRHLRHIDRVPGWLLYPLILLMCFAGAFAVNSSTFDLIVMVAGGLAGYAMRKAEVPIPPLIIALLLAPGLEAALQQSMAMSGGSLAIFVMRPGSAVLAALLLGVLVFVGVRAWRARGRFAEVPFPNPEVEIRK